MGLLLCLLMFTEPSLVEHLVPSDEEKREHFNGESISEQRDTERRKKRDFEVDHQEEGSWPQQGENSCSQQLHDNYSQGASPTESDQIVPGNIPLLQQDAFPDAKATGNRQHGRMVSALDLLSQSLLNNPKRLNNN